MKQTVPKIRGETLNITKVNFQDVIKAITNPVTHWAMLTNMLPNLSPIPISTCSN